MERLNWDEYLRERGGDFAIWVMSCTTESETILAYIYCGVTETSSVGSEDVEPFLESDVFFECTKRCEIVLDGLKRGEMSDCEI